MSCSVYIKQTLKSVTLSFNGKKKSYAKRLDSSSSPSLYLYGMDRKLLRIFLLTLGGPLPLPIQVSFPVSQSLSCLPLPLFRMTARWAARTWTSPSPHGSQLSSPQCLSPVHLTERESATQQPPLKKRTVRHHSLRTHGHIALLVVTGCYWNYVFSFVSGPFQFYLHLEFEGVLIT